jgi:hypothetical protein
LTIAIKNLKEITDYQNYINELVDISNEIELMSIDDDKTTKKYKEYKKVMEKLNIQKIHKELWKQHCDNICKKIQLPYTLQSQQDWLVWLADTFNIQKSVRKSDLSIDKIQPQLLDSLDKKIAYHLSVGAIVGTLCGLSTGILSEILNSSASYLILYVLFGFISGFISGLIGGLIAFLSSNTESIFQSLFKYFQINNDNSILQSIKNKVILWLNTNTESKLISATIGLLSAIIRFLSSVLLKWDKIQFLDIIIFGIIFGFIFYFIDLEIISPVNKIKWSFQKAIIFFKNGMGWAAFSGMCMWIIVLLNDIFLNFTPTLFKNPWLNNFIQNPWLNNFITIIRNNDLDITKENILSSVIGLLLFSVINLWLFFTISQDYQTNNNTARNDSNSAYANKRNLIYLFFLGIYMSTIIFILKIMINKIIENPEDFYVKMNIFYWGILSLEIFVGINIGLIFGFEKDEKENNNTSNTIENSSIHNILVIKKEKIKAISKELQIIKNTEKEETNNLWIRILKAIKAKINNDFRIKAFALIIILSFIVCYGFWLGYSHHSNFIWWISYRKDENYGGVLFGACVALMIGLLSILVIGENSGLTTIKHFVLRFILWNNKKILWNYDLFSEEAIEVLDKAVELDLLIKQGDSYVFKDEELRKYIAENYLKDCNSDSL